MNRYQKGIAKEARELTPHFMNFRKAKKIMRSIVSIYKDVDGIEVPKSLQKFI